MADAVRDVAAILKRGQAGAEVVIERDEPRRTISECIGLPETLERETGRVPVYPVSPLCRPEALTARTRPNPTYA